jgi:probable metal-binding protein
MSAETRVASTHGHTILRWLSETPMSAQALGARVDREIGSAARFHTCDSTELSLVALLSLLAERGKIAEVQGVWTSDLSKMCAGDD